jgi:hypothetical protein
MGVTAALATSLASSHSSSLSAARLRPRLTRTPVFVFMHSSNVRWPATRINSSSPLRPQTL